TNSVRKNFSVVFLRMASVYSLSFCCGAGCAAAAGADFFVPCAKAGLAHNEKSRANRAKCAKALLAWREIERFITGLRLKRVVVMTARCRTARGKVYPSV